MLINYDDDDDDSEIETSLWKWIMAAPLFFYVSIVATPHSLCCAIVDDDDDCGHEDYCKDFEPALLNPTGAFYVIGSMQVCMQIQQPKHTPNQYNMINSRQLKRKAHNSRKKTDNCNNETNTAAEVPQTVCVY